MKNKAEEYIQKKLAGFLMNSIKKNYKSSDIKESMNRILLDYSSALYEIQNEYKSFKDFNLFGMMIGNDICLTTEMTIMINNSEFTFTFYCTITEKCGKILHN